MNIQTGYLSQVDGSCRLQHNNNNTAVICSVSGPLEPKARQELPTTLAIELIIRPATGIPTTREINLQNLLNHIAKQIIIGTLYPRQLCQITCQILESGESINYNNWEIISCINALSCALIDSGLAMNSLALGVVVAVLKSDDNNDNNTKEDIIELDPSMTMLQSAISTHSIAFKLIYVDGKYQVDNILLVDSHGTFTQDTLFQILSLAEKHTLTLAMEVRSKLTEKIQNDLN